ncbi:hypothetical protein GCM10009836_08270 [Pseudonocardia ailaonensis]|uniref:Histidine kinase/HSP90-like ATPase domain-containing protein n=1 Tax=Pseudonocardia ailaonensis TaxID=367279 RepID=A0ABN2MN01_9PSEU
MNAHGQPDGHPADRPAPLRAVPGVLRIVHPARAGELALIRAAVSGWGRQAQLPADVLVDLLLAVGEAAANAVDHAYAGTDPGPVEVDLRVRAGTGGDRVVAARITDSGHWRPRAAPAHDRDRGRGLPMIRALATRLDITPTGHGTEVCLEIPVP